MKIFVQSVDTAFVERLKVIRKDVETVAGKAAIEQIDSGLDRGDLLFLEQMPAHGFYGLRADVVVVGGANRHSEELMAAKLGAKGFVSSDISESLLVDVIACVTSGEVWMTRQTIANVFDEYARLMSKDREDVIRKSRHR